MKLNITKSFEQNFINYTLIHKLKRIFLFIRVLHSDVSGILIRLTVVKNHLFSL